MCCDVSDWGASTRGKRYSAYFKDDVSKYIVVVHMDTTTELLQAIAKAVLEYEAEGRKIECIKVDVQYVTSDIVTFCKQRQIAMETSASHEHQQNGKAENTVKVMDRHTRSILATTDKLFPADLRRPDASDRAVISWNATTSSRDNPCVSAYAYFKRAGQRWDFHRSPMLPFGMRLEALEDAKTLNKIDRTSVGYALNPVLTGFQTINIFNVETNAVRQRRSYWTVGHPLTEFMQVENVDVAPAIEEAQAQDIVNPLHAVDRANRSMRNKQTRAETAIAKKSAVLASINARFEEQRARKRQKEAEPPTGPSAGQLAPLSIPQGAGPPTPAQESAPTGPKIDSKEPIQAIAALEHAPAPAPAHAEPQPAPKSVKTKKKIKVTIEPSAPLMPKTAREKEIEQEDLVYLAYLRSQQLKRKVDDARANRIKKREEGKMIAINNIPDLEAMVKEMHSNPKRTIKDQLMVMSAMRSKASSLTGRQRESLQRLNLRAQLYGFQQAKCEEVKRAKKKYPLQANSALAEKAPAGTWTPSEIGVPTTSVPVDFGVPLTAASAEVYKNSWNDSDTMENAIKEVAGNASPDPLAFDPDIYYSGKDPTGWKNMMKHPNSKAFLKALDDEMDQMLARNAWVVIARSSLPTGTKILDMMVKYTTKRDSKGKFLKFKARACIRGDQQTEKGETYAPTAHSTTIRLLLALAASLKMELSTMDISSAFLIENLGEDEDIYVRLPTEYTKLKGMGNEVIVKLNKSVYGLCQAPRIFHQGLDKHLKDQGYTPCVNDPCLYYKRMADGSMLYAAIHVDDILVAGSSLAHNITFKTDMAAKYDITWSDVAENFTGYLITRDRKSGTLTISQPAYARHVVEQCGLNVGCIISDTPRDHIQFTGTSKGKGDSKQLRQIVGLLHSIPNQHQI